MNCTCSHYLAVRILRAYLSPFLYLSSFARINFLALLMAFLVLERKIRTFRGYILLFHSWARKVQRLIFFNLLTRISPDRPFSFASFRLSVLRSAVSFDKVCPFVIAQRNTPARVEILLRTRSVKARNTKTCFCYLGLFRIALAVYRVNVCYRVKF